MRPPDDRHARHGSAWRVLAILLACTGPLPIHAETPAPGVEPYTARYQVSYRGLAGGQVESSLRPGSAPGVWHCAHVASACGGSSANPVSACISADIDASAPVNEGPAVGWHAAHSAPLFAATKAATRARNGFA